LRFINEFIKSLECFWSKYWLKNEFLCIKYPYSNFFDDFLIVRFQDCKQRVTCFFYKKNTLSTIQCKKKIQDIWRLDQASFECSRHPGLLKTVLLNWKENKNGYRSIHISFNIVRIHLFGRTVLKFLIIRLPSTYSLARSQEFRCYEFCVFHGLV
jgi:hypothetical protein